MPGFMAYQGFPSQYEVHKFMDLDYAQVTYFIQQVALAAKSFGVADSDIAVVGAALNSLFNVRCAPPTTVIKSQGPHLQSICIDPETCPLAKDATCSKYEAPREPEKAGSSSYGYPMPHGSKTYGYGQPTGHGSPVVTNCASSTGYAMETRDIQSTGGMVRGQGAAGSSMVAAASVPTAAAVAQGVNVLAAAAGIAALML
ncbi:hypothetical protein CDD81_217 [Ophiocordyceps australis]|uniref:Uncharacterized protein n=1 Tax=Ophiocordyceps australis TaxID=1399860 RepID=A0A2C5YGP2_9HYPO|nr:hypothetical protein CDD81_217 [Ophiocordyceps australis]